MTDGTETAPSSAIPTSSFPKQAIVVIHGMGEQRPMDTIKSFVRAVWETDTDLPTSTLRDPAEVWSKPDSRTGSLELRRMTTRQSRPTTMFADGVRSDFYELYWADLSGGSTWQSVQDWILRLLWRNPCSNVPPDVRLAWVLLWLTTIVIALIALAAGLPKPQPHSTDLGLWAYWPLSQLREVPAWVFLVISTLMTAAVGRFLVPYFGRVVRYTRADPDNIAARRNIRERGLALLAELHDGDYERIIVVGHSLGSILAYDLISYFWASRPDAHTLFEGTPAFNAMIALDRATADLAAVPASHPAKTPIDNFHGAQRRFGEILRRRPRPPAGKPDTRWLITDLVTLGSPLSHASFLVASNEDDLRARQRAREYPVCPPLRELLDDDVKKKAENAGIPLVGHPPQLLAFPLGIKQWQLHHAAPFAAVRWTNIYDPALLVFFGDIISGPVAPSFGRAVVDIDLKQVRGQASTFTHTRYWHGPENPATPPAHIRKLREALDLGAEKTFLPRFQRQSTFFTT